MTPNIYYTYAWLRVDRTPYYIGKGCGNRAYDRSRQFCPPLHRILILKRNLTESDAFKHEIYMIAVLGRKDLGTGILRNLTDGGDGASGAIRSEKTRSLIRRGLTGVPLTKKRKENIGDAKKGTRVFTNSVTGEQKHFKEDPKGDWVVGEPSEVRQKKSITKKGSLNPNYGKSPKWWVNELGETKWSENSPGSNWQRGRKWRPHD
jgi:hypothetical protein